MKINYGLLLLPLIGIVLLISESISILFNWIMWIFGCCLIIIPIVIVLYQISKYKEKEDEEKDEEEKEN